MLVLAATNRPGAIDSALMRPGRLDVQLYVPPPDLQGRLEVLKVHTSGMPLAEDVDLPGLAAHTERFSGEAKGGIAALPSCVRIACGLCSMSACLVDWRSTKIKQVCL